MERLFPDMDVGRSRPRSYWCSHFAMFVDITSGMGLTDLPHLSHLGRYNDERNNEVVRLAS